MLPSPSRREEDVEVAGTVKVHTGFRNSLDSISVTVVAEC
jgi:hypothetical protein